MYRLGLAHSFHVCFYFSFFIFSVYFCTIYIFIIIIIIIINDCGVRRLSAASYGCALLLLVSTALLTFALDELAVS